MDAKELHDKLIAELLQSPQTPREHAAVNEIKSLREKLAKLEKPEKKESK